jgi:hypothetical protein
MGEESCRGAYEVFASFKTSSVSALENVGLADFEYIGMWLYKTMNNSEVFLVKKFILEAMTQNFMLHSHPHVEI